MTRPYLWNYNRRDEIVAIPPHLFLAAVGMAIFKALYLSSGLPSVRALWQVFNIFLGDLSFLSLFLAGLYIQSTRLHFSVKIVTNFFLAVLLFWYCIDVAIISFLGTRLTIVDMFAFAREVAVFGETGSALTVLGAYITAVLYAHRFKAQISRSNLAAFSLCSVIISSLGIANVTSYSTSLELVRTNLVGGMAYKLSEEELNRFGAHTSNYVPVRSPSEDVILMVVIESFSSVDSYRTSGIGNSFPRFDEISKQGRLFTNFTANHYVTEGGIASFFVGQPPMLYPGASSTFRESMWHQDSVVRTLDSFGYHSIFLSSASLDFREKRVFTKNLGFQESYGVDDVSRFRDYPRVTFGAVTDHVLYEEALERFSRARKDHKKLLFVVETTSSHEPYVDPLGRGDTIENVLDYVDSELDWFFKELKKRGLLSKALLIVTGDHRKRMPITVPERQRYGASAEARVPLLLYGQGVQSGIDTRLFQQADLFRYLPQANNPSAPLTQAAIWVEPHAHSVFGRNPAPLRIFDKDGQTYRMELSGRRYSWNGDEIPSNKKEVELELAKRLARLQFCNDRTPLCSYTAASR